MNAEAKYKLEKNRRGKRKRRKAGGIGDGVIQQPIGAGKRGKKKKKEWRNRRGRHTTINRSGGRRSIAVTQCAFAGSNPSSFDESVPALASD